MSNVANDPIDDVAEGDVVDVDRGSGSRPYQVVFKSADETPQGTVFTVTFQDTDGETFQQEYPAGTVVARSLESKWESPQSPTQHNG
ncbi:hypothetical protein O6P37_21395 [Mycobacterium sp. CPCC 205372]|jgi:hypothetical protein|uniref:Uncharacterized protein n=2 Tax=Mycobacteriaceae TaxID=1762 RepID=A0A9X3BVM6_9MYCO|nr:MULTISPECIES: hypothetical protein [Mycobacteriaceae]MCV7169442.1 hypothetical protein [[Mycobacterium] manitobense]MCZ8381430.1 hypothetical protein [Mycobacterium hippophais]